MGKFTGVIKHVPMEPWVFFAFISKSVNNQCYNPYISGKLFRSSTIWSKENDRNRKFIADNYRLKKTKFFPIRNFEIFKPQFERLDPPDFKNVYSYTMVLLLIFISQKKLVVGV